MGRRRRRLRRWRVIGVLMAGALGAGGALGSSSFAGSDAKIQCTGVNACEGQSACKSANNACKGQNSCKGKGFLQMTQEEIRKDAQQKIRELLQGK